MKTQEEILESIVADMRKLANDYMKNDRECGEFAIAYCGDVADELREFARRIKAAMKKKGGDK